MIRIDAATEEDVGTIRHLIRGLAEFEGLLAECSITEEDLCRTLFAQKPAAEVRLARDGSDVVGYALFFPTYSSFLGRPGIWLEDLFVVPECRGRGVGRALLTDLASEALARGCGRLEWAVLDWNERAVDFYRSLGARSVDGWATYRLTGEALRQAGGKT